ncbi:MAG: plasmid mobilization relaxosome protein MobC [Eubacteriales bacterium]|nr:plasmid mobilization relaxosome protein MobC [Eubacteriales bacterium]
MANRKRDIPIQFFVTSDEKKQIRKKMILSKTSNLGAYLRKMAIDGIIVNTDTSYLEKQYFEMHRIGVNVNQLAKLANTTGAVTPQEMNELKGMIKEIWHILRSSASNLQ